MLTEFYSSCLQAQLSRLPFPTVPGVKSFFLCMGASSCYLEGCSTEHLDYLKSFVYFPHLILLDEGSRVQTPIKVYSFSYATLLLITIVSLPYKFYQLNLAIGVFV